MSYLDFFLYYVLTTLLVVAFVIFIHELGHFWMARHFGESPKIFSVGFGREIFGFTDKRGTRWKFSIFPIGGYVEVGQDESRPLYQRVLVTLAGPLANVVTAIVILFFAFAVLGIPRAPALIVGVDVNGGAHSVGVRAGDLVTEIDGKPVPFDTSDIKEIVEKTDKSALDVGVVREGKNVHFSIPVRYRDDEDDFGDKIQKKKLGVMFAGSNFKLATIPAINGIPVKDDPDKGRALIKENFGKEIVMTIGPEGDTNDFIIVPEADKNRALDDPAHRDYGILVLFRPEDRKVERMGVFGALEETFVLCGKAVSKFVGGIYKLVVGRDDTSDLGGVLKIGEMTGDISSRADQTGMLYVFKLIALLSMNIGFINLLPLPLLDGGHLALHAYEAVRGKPPSLRVKGYFYGFGIVFVAIIGSLAYYHDLMEIITRK